ncbi:MurR/RpiR family transcriptional regulator [Lacticaseibacillus pantheris]|uniref:MurR/RpiR family transcriptional regulator n=1 Tax=Lacticaseibacillus pantheris TaxID=171523 RepID=UPI00265AC5CF|nr:MurR/RpiR family transcriptional regulator [Lacticaseibacillus pantheris]WKF85881.1 MurR/RpiR family transcriptional regulator [Lacticaseibacillus pantheris]
MIIQQLKNETHFSSAEATIRDYLLREMDSLPFKSAVSIANELYVSKSTLTRFAQKLGFSGWISFKERAVQEMQAEKLTVNKIDTNFPFLPTDSQLTIAKKIMQLKHETITQTRELLDPQTLKRATQLIETQKHIQIFAQGYSAIASQEFCSRMIRTNKLVSNDTHGGMEYIAQCLDSQDLAIIVSYSGGTESLLKLLPILRGQHVPMLAITSNTPSKIYQYSDLKILIPSSENLYLKIGNYTADDSIRYIFDVLYSIHFSLRFDDYLSTRSHNAKITDRKMTDNFEN